MNATRRDSVPLLRIAAASLWIVACGEPSSEAAKGTIAASSEPLVVAPRAEPSQNSQFTTRAGGVATRYTPQFDGDVLVRIDEQREGDASVQPAHGTYAFHGARLMRYEGAPLDGTGTVLLEFDLQGKIITARHGDAAAAEEQIGAIRTRAQLLRSHALAQRVARTHPTNR